MTAVVPERARSLDGDSGPRAPTRAPPDRTRVVLVAFVALTIATVLLWVIASVTSVRRGVRSLPDEERRALFARTVEELRQYCGPGRPDGLADHCRELASFASQFDECTGECDGLVRRELVRLPTR